ncbi:protein kinase [Streptomyces fructofermentans]
MTGRYRLAGIIGQGGMGRVWRAVDEILDRPVAVKEMRIDGMDQEDTRTRRERTLREARATARMDHPGIVRVYDVVDEGERLWIVMELVDGRSLERVVAEDGPLGPRGTARIGLELVAALGQVHAGGVLHRDIKPGNVLVERRAGRVVLTDFGIAAIRDAEALTMAGMLVGSPDYMAPERISGRPQGPPSDLWSLGATLCAALGGRSPFSRATTFATLHAVLYEEPVIPPVADGLREVLAALLDKDPARRPGLDALAEALGPLARGDTASRGTAGTAAATGDAGPDGRVGAAQSSRQPPDSAPGAGPDSGSRTATAWSAGPAHGADPEPDPGADAGAPDAEPARPAAAGAGRAPAGGADAAVAVAPDPGTGAGAAPARTEGSVPRPGPDPERGPSPRRRPDPPREARATDTDSGTGTGTGTDSGTGTDAQPSAGPVAGAVAGGPSADGPPEPPAVPAAGPEPGTEPAGRPGTEQAGGERGGPADGPGAASPGEPDEEPATGRTPAPAQEQEQEQEHAQAPPEDAVPVPAQAPSAPPGQPAAEPKPSRAAVPDREDPRARVATGDGTGEADGRETSVPEEPPPPVERPTSRLRTDSVPRRRPAAPDPAPDPQEPVAASRPDAASADPDPAPAEDEEAASAGTVEDAVPVRRTPTPWHRPEPGETPPAADPSTGAGDPVRTTAASTASESPAEAFPETTPGPSAESPTRGPLTVASAGTALPAPPAAAGNVSSESSPEGTPEISSAGAAPGTVYAPSGPGTDTGPGADPWTGTDTGPGADPGTDAGARQSEATEPVRAAGEAGHELPTQSRPLAPPPPVSPDEPPGPGGPSGPRRIGGRGRKALMAAAGVAVAGLVAALVVPGLGGSPEGDDKASASSPAASSAASGGPSSGGGGGPSSSSPPGSPTVAGTVRPPTLPAGSRTEAGMYAWVPPKGWERAAQSGAEVHYSSPDRKQEVLANASPARGDLFAQWKKTEEIRSKGLNYRRIRLEETTFRGGPAVVWEYTVTAKGLPWHALLLGFDSGGRTYEITTWYRPEVSERAVPVYEEVKEGFTPL